MFNEYNMELVFFCLFLGCVSAYVEKAVPDYKKVFDQNLYNDALDAELCSEQLAYMSNNNSMLMYTFIDSSFRTPKGILEGNLADYGNYYQCLNINEESPVSKIEGKFCMIRVPLQQNLTLPSLPQLPDITWPPNPNPEWSRLNSNIMRQSHQIRGYPEYLPNEASRVATDSELANYDLLLAVCVPKVCTTKEAINEVLLFDVGLEYSDVYCRLPGDKRWVAADYVFIVVFSFLLLLVAMSTAFDVYQTVVLGRDAKRLSKLLLSFSVYTNTRRLFSYNAVPGTIECLDGIRSFAMMWVIVGHTYVNQVSFILANPNDVLNWITSVGGLWITTGPITVDTFFMLSGLLLVYTTVGKMSGDKLLRMLHLFYLNRILRMFPLLAAYVLIHASLLNWISDGPYWSVVATHVERCRMNWWSTLLHVQNWVNPLQMCLSHSWYLAIDVQLYIISPLFLYWILGGRKLSSWIALATGLILSLAGSSVYNFIMNFQSGPIMPSRPAEDQVYFLKYYYVNTLCRASPFFVGMVYGYLLSMYKNEKLNITRIQASILWICSFAILAAVVGVHYPIMQRHWQNQTIDNFLNSYMRPAWALAVGWIVFGCATGYGGPLNWVLSLRCFKVLSRLSYGMYIVHFPLIFVVNSSSLSPVYFGVQSSVYIFLADFLLAAIAAYLLTMLVDAPCSTLIKLAMGGGPKRPQQARIIDNEPKQSASTGIVNEGFEKEVYKTDL